METDWQRQMESSKMGIDPAAIVRLFTIAAMPLLHGKQAGL
jgi:hypothetical protein